MQSLFASPKRQGEWAELAFMTKAARMGWNVILTGRIRKHRTRTYAKGDFEFLDTWYLIPISKIAGIGMIYLRPHPQIQSKNLRGVQGELARPDAQTLTAL